MLLHMTRNWLFLLLLACAASAAASSAGVDLQGKVVDSKGKSLPGVMVRFTSAATGRSEVVFSDAMGQYHNNTGLRGELSVRYRLPYYRDALVAINVAGDDIVPPQQQTMVAMESDQEISDSLPPVYHFGKIRFDQDPESFFSRPLMQRDCTGCHALGTPLTRRPRSKADWVPTVKRMHAFVGNADANRIEERAARIAEALDGKPLTVRPQFPVDEASLKAKIYEYSLPEVLFPHDMDISEVDGRAYTVDRFGDKIIITDLASGESAHYPQPPSSRPVVKEYSYTGRSHKPGPHSLALGADNLWYTTNAGSTEIGVFDASSRTWKDSYVLPDNTAYAHTIRVNHQDNTVWFTLAASEQVGRVDPASGEISIIDLPQAKPIGMPIGTSPYGIAIHPDNGQVWYARLFGDRIGYIDPGTLEVSEFNSPVKGPRRLRFDATGTLWVTGYSEGNIARIDNANMDSRVYPIPTFGEGYTAGPYALAVHPQTQQIWINDTHTDRVYRFDPETETFSSYPMPLRGTYTRDFAFTEDGWACTANSPIMNAALEGGVAELICVDANDSGVD